jgi:hypothetical protein
LFRRINKIGCPSEKARVVEMLRAGTWVALLAFVVTLGAMSSAEARKWRGWRVHGFVHLAHPGYHAHPGGMSRRSRPARLAEQAPVRTNETDFNRIVSRIIHGCAQRASELRDWPFDAITRTVAPNDAQREALETLRMEAGKAADRLAADCPQNDATPSLARFEAVTQALDATINSVTMVEPAVKAFYVALDDEQQARLVREVVLSSSQARTAERDVHRSERRSRRRADPAPAASGKPEGGICEQLTAAMRGWPVRQIERSVRLAEPQRVAFYELVTASLKAADALTTGCPRETALTPPGRMAEIRARLSAVRQAASEIRPALGRFYETLDQEQKVRFAGLR